MCWFLASLLLLSSSTVMETSAGEPSVYHIESSKGNFFLAPRMTIDRSQAKYILTKDVNNCTCKRACSAVACEAWSVVMLDDGKAECRLANEGPRTFIPVENTNATYFFTEDSVDGTYSFQTGDQLLYVELNISMLFDVGKKACENIPGHRLMIIKTLVQYAYFQSLWDTHRVPVVLVDMKKVVINSTVEHLWGDGTFYSETELEEAFIFDNDPINTILPVSDLYINYQGLFHDYHRSVYYAIICQANPFGVEW